VGAGASSSLNLFVFGIGVILKNEFCPTFRCPGIFFKICL
jgi:hypothetical protein